MGMNKKSTRRVWILFSHVERQRHGRGSSWDAVRPSISSRCSRMMFLKPDWHSRFNHVQPIQTPMPVPTTVQTARQRNEWSKNICLPRTTPAPIPISAPKPPMMLGMTTTKGASAFNVSQVSLRTRHCCCFVNWVNSIGMILRGTSGIMVTSAQLIPTGGRVSIPNSEAAMGGRISKNEGVIRSREWYKGA